LNRKFLMVSIVTIVFAISFLTSATLAFASVMTMSAQPPEISSTYPFPERFVYITAEGKAESLRDRRVVNANLEVFGMVNGYLPIRPLHRTGENIMPSRPAVGRINIELLLVEVGDNIVVFESGKGLLTERHIFLTARNQGSTYCRIWLLGVRTRETGVRFHGYLIIKQVCSSLTEVWRLALTGKIILVPKIPISKMP